MPSKHIDDDTWAEVEKLTVKAVKKTNMPIKATDVLKYLIHKGIEVHSCEEFKNWILGQSQN